jgi:hypothetical protein
MAGACCLDFPGVPCLKTDPLIVPAKPQPVIRLLPSPALTVYVQYGKPSPFYLGPCASGTSTGSCGAVAWDVQPGKGQVDLTPYIAVTQTQDDCDPEQGQVGRNGIGQVGIGHWVMGQRASLLHCCIYSSCGCTCTVSLFSSTAVACW